MSSGRVAASSPAHSSSHRSRSRASASASAPEQVSFAVPGGTGAGDVVQVQAPSGRNVSVRVPAVAAAHGGGATVVASVPAGYRGGVLSAAIDPRRKGRGLSGRWEPFEKFEKKELEEEEEEEETVEGVLGEQDAVDAGDGLQDGTEERGGGGGGGRMLERPRLGPRSQPAGLGQPLLVVRNEVVRTGRRDYAIDPLLPAPGAAHPAWQLASAVRQALHDRGWVYPVEEQVSAPPAPKRSLLTVETGP
jgi:hypothetical protein